MDSRSPISRLRPAAVLAIVVLALWAPAQARQVRDTAAEPSAQTSSAQGEAPLDEQGARDQEATSDDQPAGQALDELRRRIDVLAAEVEELRSGEPPAAPLTERERTSLGLGPSASRVYERPEGVSFSGYGEMLFERFDEADQSGGGRMTPRIDFLRAILYTGYRFNDRILFNSEIEFEHGGEEVGVEFAFLDYRVTDSLSLRGGLLLVPLGLVNEYHEPNVFLGARRPETERRLIPSTWRENGLGAVGGIGPVNFRAYLINGFDARGFGSAGLRGGRQNGIEAKAANWAFAGRLDVTPIVGIVAGVGLYTGRAGQNLEFEGETLDVATTLVELHGQVQIRGFDLRGLFARATVGDTWELYQTLGTSAVGRVQQGGYAQIGYNLLSQTSARISLLPFYRFERVDTQHEMVRRLRAFKDAAFDTTLHTLGAEFKPIGQVVVKTDYQWITNRAMNGRNQFNVALGYAF